MVGVECVQKFASENEPDSLPTFCTGSNDELNKGSHFNSHDGSSSYIFFIVGNHWVSVWYKISVGDLCVCRLSV